MLLGKSLKYSPKVMAKKAIYKVFGLTHDYLDYLENIIFGTELSDSDLQKKVLSTRTEEIYFGLPWQPFLSKEIKNKIIEEADKARSHIFNLLGSGDEKVDYKLRAVGLEGYRYDMRVSEKKYLSIKEKIQTDLERIFQKCIEYEPIDWQVDFKSGYRWSEKTYYRFIKYSYKLGVDVKLPWELSRAQHLLPLALFYDLTKKGGYAEEIIKQIVDWILTNPCKFGINWRCTMDVALRVANWIVAINLSKGYIDNLPLTGKEYFHKVFFKSLYQHGDFITRSLGWSENLTSNHYLSDIAGLLILAIFAKGTFKEAKKWKNFGIEELKKEMERQVYPDGVDFEASTCYHRLVLELFFYATFLVIINDKNFKEDNFIEVGNEIFGEKYIQRLYKMFEFVLYALKPNGRMPQIGDNDNGRFLHVSIKREILDMRYLLTLGAIFFKESKFKVKEFGFCEEALWVFGKKGYKIWQDLEENCLADIGSRAFPNTGWYIMRNDRDYMIISCGPNGQNENGGHCHNDKLSFELCIDGEDIIVDPGTYVYTPDPEARNKFRGAAYHNTVMVDGKEQNRFDEKNLFWMENETLPKCLKWQTNDEIDIFIGEHYGYKRFAQPVIHKREIRYYKKDKKWEVIDKFTGEGEHNLEWNLILSPEFKQELQINSDKLQWHREPAFYSSEYGMTTKTEKLTSTLKATIPVEVKFRIEIEEK